MKSKPSHPRSSLSFTIPWLRQLRRQTTSLHDLARSAALLTDGAAPLESFDSLLVNNKLALGQELLTSETQQLKTLHSLGFLQESSPGQENMGDGAAPSISLQDLTLDALAQSALELQKELLAFLLQVSQQKSLYPSPGDLALQRDLLQLNRHIRTLAIHCDMVSGTDRPGELYNADPIATSPVVLQQMTTIAATLVRCAHQSYEPRVWSTFFGTPPLQFSALRDKEEKPGKAGLQKLKREVEQLRKNEERNQKDIEKLQKEVEQLKKGLEDALQKRDTSEQLKQDFEEKRKACQTAKQLASLMGLHPQSINSRVAVLADLNWLHRSKQGKERCFTPREVEVIQNNPWYKNLGPVVI